MGFRVGGGEMVRYKNSSGWGAIHVSITGEERGWGVRKSTYHMTSNWWRAGRRGVNGAEDTLF